MELASPSTDSARRPLYFVLEEKKDPLNKHKMRSNRALPKIQAFVIGQNSDESKR